VRSNGSDANRILEVKETIINIRIDLKETGHEDGYCIHLA
jgi:hypothetical protein